MLKSIILDLSERTEVEFSVGFQATEPFLWMPYTLAKSFTDQVAAFAGGTGGVFNQITCNGQIVVQVEAPLTAPLTTNHVPVLVSISAGDDFEVCHHNMSQLTSMSITSGLAYDRGAVEELAPTLTRRPTAAVTTEMYNHLRPLLARYQIKMDLNLGRPPSSDSASNRVAIPSRGWTGIGASATPGVDFMRPTIGAWFFATESAVISYVTLTALDYFRTMYSGERGALKWRAHHFDFGATEASVINAWAAPWTDWHGGATTTVFDFNGASGLSSTAVASYANTDAYQWGGDSELSPVGVSVPYGFSLYYAPFSAFLSPPATGSGGQTGVGGVVGFDVYRKSVNSATTERNVTSPFVTNKFTLLLAAGDDYTLVGFNYTPLMTTA
jgi:hypothetical protein